MARRNKYGGAVKTSVYMEQSGVEIPKNTEAIGLISPLFRIIANYSIIHNAEKQEPLYKDSHIATTSHIPL